MTSRSPHSQVCSCWGAGRESCAGAGSLQGAVEVGEWELVPDRAALSWCSREVLEQMGGGRDSHSKHCCVSGIVPCTSRVPFLFSSQSNT